MRPKGKGGMAAFLLAAIAFASTGCNCSSSATKPECKADDDCKGRGEEVCAQGTCARCTVDRGCPAAAPRCIDGLRCAECEGSWDCGAGQICENDKCHAGCDAARPCPDGMFCSGSGVCVGCLRDADCPLAAPRCASGACVRCVASEDCPPGFGCTQSQCAADCAAHACGAGMFCNAASRRCVSCLDDGHCARDNSKPICMASGTCGACEFPRVPCAAGSWCKEGRCEAGCQPGMAATCPLEQLCDPASHACVPGCETANDCPESSTCETPEGAAACFSDRWVEIPLVNHPPEAKNVAAVYFQGEIHMIGGRTRNPDSVIAQHQKLGSAGVSEVATGGGPGAIWGAMAVVDVNRPGFLVIGGSTTTDLCGGLVADQHRWIGNGWVREGNRGNLPPVAGAAVATCPAANGRGSRLVIFGGFVKKPDGTCTLSADTFESSIAGGWRRLPTPVHPPPQMDHSLAAGPATLELFNGTDAEGRPIGDGGWAFTCATSSWSPRYLLPRPEPAIRACAWHPLRRVFLCVGGNEGSSEQWTFSEGGWVLEQPAQLPPNDFSAALQYFPPRQRMVFFGLTSFWADGPWPAREGP